MKFFFSVGFNVVVMVLMFVSCPRGFVQPATSFQFFKVQSPGQIVNNVVPEGRLLWPKKRRTREMRSLASVIMQIMNNLASKREPMAFTMEYTIFGAV